MVSNFTTKGNYVLLSRSVQVEELSSLKLYGIVGAAAWFELRPPMVAQFFWIIFALSRKR